MDRDADSPRRRKRRGDARHQQRGSLRDRGDILSEPRPPRAARRSWRRSSRPGLDDTWEFGGPCTTAVSRGSRSRVQRGARFSGLHSWSGTISTIVGNVRRSAGTSARDGRIDFRSAGTNQLPTLATLLKYGRRSSSAELLSTSRETRWRPARELHGRGREHRPDAVHARQRVRVDRRDLRRYENEKYAPMQRATATEPRVTGHDLRAGPPLLDGRRHDAHEPVWGEHFDVTPRNARRRLEQRRVLAATNTNPKGNGRPDGRVELLPPRSSGRRRDYLQLIVNAARWASRSRTRR